MTSAISSSASNCLTGERCTETVHAQWKAAVPALQFRRGIQLQEWVRTTAADGLAKQSVLDPTEKLKDRPDAVVGLQQSLWCLPTDRTIGGRQPLRSLFGGPEGLDCARVDVPVSGPFHCPSSFSTGFALGYEQHLMAVTDLATYESMVAAHLRVV